MTQQEQDALIGRLVREIPEKKTELVCLERKATEIANAYRAVADYVLHALQPLGDFDVNPPRMPDTNLLGLIQAAEIVEQIHKARVELAKLEEMKQRAGLA